MVEINSGVDTRCGLVELGIPDLVVEISGIENMVCEFAVVLHAVVLQLKTLFQRSMFCREGGRNGH